MSMAWSVSSSTKLGSTTPEPQESPNLQLKVYVLPKGKTRGTTKAQGVTRDIESIFIMHTQ